MTEEEIAAIAKLSQANAEVARVVSNFVEEIRPHMLKFVEIYTRLGEKMLEELKRSGL